MTDIDKRIDEIKPCPFCGFRPKAGHIIAGDFWALHLHHQSKIKCPLEGFVIEGEEGFMQWNTRPIETALQAQVVERDRVLHEIENILNAPDLSAAVRLAGIYANIATINKAGE